LTRAWGVVRGMKVSVKGGEVGLQSSEELGLDWSAELHLQLLGLFQDVAAFLRTMSYLLLPPNAQPLPAAKGRKQPLSCLMNQTTLCIESKINKFAIEH